MTKKDTPIIQASRILGYPGKVIDVNSWSRGKYDRMDPFRDALKSETGIEFRIRVWFPKQGRFGVEK